MALTQVYSPLRPPAGPVATVPEFWISTVSRSAEPVALPAPELVARLTAFERATARLLLLNHDTLAPASAVGEALTRLRLWHRDRGLHFHSTNRLARHLQQSMARPAHPAGWRLAKHGWALLAALDATDLAVIELTSESSRERIRLAARLAELGGVSA